MVNIRLLGIPPGQSTQGAKTLVDRIKKAVCSVRHLVNCHHLTPDDVNVQGTVCDIDSSLAEPNRVITIEILGLYDTDTRVGRPVIEVLMSKLTYATAAHYPKAFRVVCFPPSCWHRVKTLVIQRRRQNPVKK